MSAPVDLVALYRGAAPGVQRMWEGDPKVRAAIEAAGERIKRLATPRWRTDVYPIARSDGRVVTVVLKGLVLVSELNEREHWAIKARRAQWQRELIEGALRCVDVPRGPWRVTIERTGVGQLDDDNLAGSAKHARDAVAAWLGCGDSARDPVTWQVMQRRGDYGVRVTIEGGAA